MGRYSVDALKNYNPQQFGGCPTHQPQQQFNPSNWPTSFPKGIVGLDRDGTINEDMGEYITNASQLRIMPSSLEAIRTIRLKGHKLVILTNQAGVNKGIQTQAQVDAVNQTMMRVFGENGIFSIDGLYYATSNLKEDYYAKPNVGMFKRAQEEIQGIDWNSGWYVGDKITDLKAAEKVGATPILVLTGHGNETLKKLDTFANKDLKKKTKVFNNLLEFANSL